MDVRPVGEEERTWLRSALQQRWGDVVVGRGRVWRPHELPALVALEGAGERVGIATYLVEGDTAELVTLDHVRITRQRFNMRRILWRAPDADARQAWAAAIAPRQKSELAERRTAEVESAPQQRAA